MGCVVLEILVVEIVVGRVVVIRSFEVEFVTEVVDLVDELAELSLRVNGCLVDWVELLAVVVGRGVFDVCISVIISLGLFDVLGVSVCGTVVFIVVLVEVCTVEVVTGGNFVVTRKITTTKKKKKKQIRNSVLSGKGKCCH